MSRHSRRVATAAVVATIVVAAGCGGGSTPPNDNPGPVGTPAGTASSADIGPGGGSVSASDGQFTIQFPAGALTTTTRVTIQPIVNTVPNAVGLAYAISPAGLTVTQPVTITMPVDDAALGTNTPEGLGIATLSSTNEWAAHISSTADVSQAPAASASRFGGRPRNLGRVVSVGLNLTGPVPYAFTVTAMWQVKITPDSVIDTGTSASITIEVCVNESAAPTGPLEDELPPLPTCVPSIRQGTWFVNGTRGGDAVDGIVTALSPTSTARYDAPGNPPTTDPVTVLASMFWAQRGLTKTFEIPIRVKSNAWTGTVTYTFTGDTTWQTSDAVSTTTYTKKWTGSAEIGLMAAADEISSLGGVFSATSILATQTLDDNAHEVQQIGSCVQTRDADSHQVGNFAEPAPEHEGDGSVSVSFTGSTYTLSFSSVEFQLTGPLVQTQVRKGCGPSDGTDTNSNPLTTGTSVPTAVVTMDLDPAHPGVLKGSVMFVLDGQTWKQVKLEWDIRRP